MASMRWSTRRRVLLVALVPTITVAAVLLSLLGDTELSRLRSALNRELAVSAHQWRVPAAEALHSGHLRTLQGIVDSLVDNPTVAEARIERGDGSTVVSARSHAPRVTSMLGGALMAATAFERLDAGVMTVMLDTATTPMPPSGGTLTVTPDHGWAYQRYAAVMLPPLGLAAAVAGIATLLALAVANSLVTPTRRLTRFTTRIRRGELDGRLRADAGGEIGELEEAMNRMVQALGESREALEARVRQTTSELRQTLQAVEVQNVELDVARRRALEASKVKSEFVANVSHEIRTPINGIVGFADLLHHSPLNAEQRDYVDTIRQSCSNLLTIINDILDFSKIEAGKMALDSVDFDLRDCVEEVFALLAPEAYDKRLEIVQLVYADVPTRLRGDPLRLRQVLTNLVHNAIKFTPAGEVTVRVMIEEEDSDSVSIRFNVSDTGVGLHESDRDKLFRAFSQADTSLTRRFGGTGLGLIISRKLVEQMGGTIGLESEPGVGSTFWFTARLERRPEPASPAPATPLDGRHALLYDDSHLTRLATRHRLEQWGMTVTGAGIETLEARLAENDWALLVAGIGQAALDTALPGHLITTAHAAGVPVLVLASTVDREIHQQLTRLGAAATLPRVARRQAIFRELCRVVDFAGTSLPRLPAPDTADEADAADAEGNALDGANVLVVDDNEINRKLITTIAARNGVRVVEAGDGTAAVDACRHEWFDTVFMDIHMPGISGEEAARRIIASYDGRRPPRIIALTANAMSGERERLLAAGMDDCLIKPVTEVQILAAIGRDGPAPEHSSVDNDTRSTLREMMLDELPDHRQRIVAAVETGDRATLREHVHKLHGAASVCGPEALRSACAELEGHLVAGDAQAIPGAVDDLLEAIDTVSADSPA